MTGARSGGKSANVTWELSEEGKVVVDVDTPLRPFGDVTPARGMKPAPGDPSANLDAKDETEPDGAPSDDLSDFEDTAKMPPSPPSKPT